MPVSLPPSTAPWRVMKLSLWAPPTAAWHARLVEPGAPERVFDSPFELARYLSNSAVAALPAEAASKPGGLR